MKRRSGGCYTRRRSSPNWPTGFSQSSYPLAHLLTESHKVPTVSHFLSQLAHSYRLATKSALESTRVVTLAAAAGGHGGHGPTFAQERWGHIAFWPHLL